MNLLRLPVLLLALFACVTAIAADPKPADEAARLAEIRKLVAELKPQSGEIVLEGGIAKITVPPTLRYFSPKDTKTVLTKLWGNPDHGPTLGMLAPAGFDPFSDDSWAVIITFKDDGYIKDDDAASIDYTKLMAQMKEGTAKASKERVKQGYPAIELIGWAAPPRYDSKEKKLYWAKEIKFGDSREHTLNYDFRLLGRRGVLSLNAVASMGQLKMIEAHTAEILGAVNFQDGHRYADFTESTDKVATYGLAALVVGGVAAKAGLLKGLWIAIIALKKFIIIGLIALSGVIKKYWSKLMGRGAPAHAFAALTPAPAPAAPSEPTVPPSPPADPAPPTA